MKKINKKGFTLVELIATIVVLALVMSIGSYSIIKILENAKEKNYELLIKNIESAASLYYQECRFSETNGINASCYFDFNFDGLFTDDDALKVLNCVNDSFTGEYCNYVKDYGDIDGNGQVNEDDAKHVLMGTFFDEYSHLNKKMFFTSLKKLVDLGYLKGNEQDKDDKYILKNSRNNEEIGGCVILVNYDNIENKIINIGAIDGINESNCPSTDDYKELMRK